MHDWKGARVLHCNLCQKRCKVLLVALYISRRNNINKRLRDIVWVGPAAALGALKFMGR